MLCTLYFASLAVSSISLECNYLRHRKDGKDKSLANCTGDYCYTFTVAFEIGYDLGCVTGIVLKTKCWTDLSGTLCMCDSDHCNTPELRDSGEQHGRLECVHKEDMYSNDMHGNASVYSKIPGNQSLSGFVCDAVGEFRGLGTSNPEGIMIRGERGRQAGSFRIITGRTVTEQGDRTRIGELTLFYYGGFYLHDFGSDFTTLWGRCRSPRCNNWSLNSIERKGVKCKARYSSLDTPGAGIPIPETHCEGQMCGIAIVPTEMSGKMETISSYFCFSQNATRAEYPITVGYYSDMGVQYFVPQHFYLCDQDYCNTNVTTAMKSIAKYKKEHPSPPNYNIYYNVASRHLELHLYVCSYLMLKTCFS